VIWCIAQPFLCLGLSKLLHVLLIPLQFALALPQALDPLLATLYQVFQVVAPSFFLQPDIGLTPEGTLGHICDVAVDNDQRVLHKELSRERAIAPDKGLCFPDPTVPEALRRRPALSSLDIVVIKGLAFVPLLL